MKLKHLVSWLLIGVALLGAGVKLLDTAQQTGSSSVAKAQAKDDQQAVLTQAKTAAVKSQQTAATTKTTLQETLLAQWQAILDQTSSRVDIAIYLPERQQTIQLSNDATTSTHATASIIKATILTQVLHQAEQQGTALTTAESEQATEMIENSSNDAATYFLQTILGGYGATDQLFSALAMTDSSADTEAWGLTQTTANDQLKLLNTIFYNSAYLSTADQAYIQSLMGQVSAEQSWGVSTGSASWQLKNGWLTDEGNTMINSIGHVTTTGGNDYTIAVLTDQNESEATGQALIGQLAQATATVIDQN